MQYTHTNVSGAVQRSCSLLQIYERSLKREGGRCVGGGKDEIKPPKNVHCSCSLLQTHEMSLKRGGGWEATFQFLVLYAYLVGTAPVLNADHRAQPDIKNPIMYKLSIILFVRDQRTVVVSLLQPQGTHE